MALVRTARGWMDDSQGGQIDLPFAGQRRDREVAGAEELKRDEGAAERNMRQQIAAEHNATQLKIAEINKPERYVKGGPVTGKYTKGTGAVDIGDWTAPMKSRGAR